MQKKNCSFAQFVNRLKASDFIVAEMGLFFKWGVLTLFPFRQKPNATFDGCNPI